MPKRPVLMLFLLAVLLQTMLANIGSHQLHLSTSNLIDTNSHTHIVLEPSFSEQNISQPSVVIKPNDLTQLSLESIELCLDCQCGSHWPMYVSIEAEVFAPLAFFLHPWRVEKTNAYIYPTYKPPIV